MHTPFIAPDPLPLGEHDLGGGLTVLCSTDPAVLKEYHPAGRTVVWRAQSEEAPPSPHVKFLLDPSRFGRLRALDALCFDIYSTKYEHPLLKVNELTEPYQLKDLAVGPRIKTLTLPDIIPQVELAPIVTTVEAQMREGEVHRTGDIYRFVTRTLTKSRYKPLHKDAYITDGITHGSFATQCARHAAQTPMDTQPAKLWSLMTGDRSIFALTHLHREAATEPAERGRCWSGTFTL